MDIIEWFPEFKVSAESDSDLMRYFVKTPLLDRILKQGKWMVIGRKGTGKTAVYEYLRQASQSDLGGIQSIALSFKDYPWPIQRLYRESMESEISSYQRSWKYIIITKSLAALIETLEKTGKLPNDLADAKKLLKKIFGNPNPDLLEIVKSKIFRIKSLSLPSAEFDEASLSLGGFEFDDVAEHEELQRKLRANAFQLLNYFDNIYKKHSTTTRQLIIIDQLDENWLHGEIEEYSKILVNLILCAQNINNSHEYRDHLKVVVFLRSDIYDTLRFNDKNKVYQDGAVEIKWAAESLDAMVTERIQKYAPSTLNLSLATEHSASIFEKKTVRHGATPLKHMLRRSFYRPRDLIVYLNKLREAHKPATSGLYTSKDLYAAERNVSSSMYDELIDEWAAQNPDFESYLLTLQNIGYEIFTTEQYVEKYQSAKPSATLAEIYEILRFLFTNSIIGQKISVNWEYVCTNPHMQIDFKNPFHVNNGLKYRLVLTENREKRKKKSGSK
ncbi:hypothetical protein SAMN05216189_100870 [Pseudomonas delhiensis]|uniref:KAP family P-loop domain-containing protein n=1 Tax=Pseudomonas delhiensis TaxID=366289 RepID=A0A239FVE8_9PSED|nr:ATP-binding protein [Pseudomonas delhiensis]SDI72776.1 hypothetical protein SAMN05216189_100870 [Pseudomonas delhiensis]SNS60132.1 hypothetical protein SAMN06295949_10470 [Pseudomonas delhiensis]